jgi:hypothetical protein
MELIEILIFWKSSLSLLEARLYMQNARGMHKSV